MREHFLSHSVWSVLSWYSNQSHYLKTTNQYTLWVLAKVLNKTLINGTQKHIERIMYHDQVVFIPGMQGWFNMKMINVVHQVNKIKEKSISHISTHISMDTENLTKFSFFKVHDKNTQQTRNRRTLPQHNKSHIWKPPLNIIILNGERLKAFPLRSQERLGCPVLPLLFNIVLEVLARAVRQEKEVNAPKLGRSKFTFVDNMILWVENPKDFFFKFLNIYLFIWLES